MPHTFSQENFHGFCDELATTDADLHAIIQQHGYPPMWSRPNTFETLVHIILEQQVSLASALAALEKLREKTGEITPENILTLTDEELRACYCSRQKSGYIRSLAGKLRNDELDLIALQTLTDEDVRVRLLDLKGVGHWTVDIYLIFVLHRLDVFPVGDLAAVSALRKIKKLDNAVSRDILLMIADSWKPYRSVATMLLWHEYLSSRRR